MVALARSVTVGMVTYAAGTDHTTMPAADVDQIRNPAAWVGGVAPALSSAADVALTRRDLSSVQRLRTALGVTDSPILPIGTTPGTVAAGDDVRFPDLTGAAAGYVPTFQTATGRLAMRPAPVPALESAYGATMPLISKLRMQKRNAVTILQLGDSTTVGQSAWPGRLTGKMATAWPTWSFAYRDWSLDTATDYSAATTVSTGTGSGTVTMFNMGIPTTNSPNVLAAKFSNAVLNIPTPDLIIIGHGHNESGGGTAAIDYDPAAYANLAVLIATLKMHHPTSPILVVLGNPVTNASNSTQERRNDSYRKVAADTGVALADMYHVFTGAPGWTKSPVPSAYMIDETHPNAGGHELIATALVPYFSPPADGVNSTLIPDVSQQQSSLLLRKRSLIADGDLSGYVTGAPQGWTIAGGATVVKDTALVDSQSGLGYSVRITGSGTAAGYLERDVPVAHAQGRTICLTVREYVPAAAPAGNASGMISIVVDGVEQFSGTTNFGRGGWYFRSIHARVPVTAASVKIRLYGSTSASVAGDAYFSEASVTVGALPSRALPQKVPLLQRNLTGFPAISNTTTETSLATLTIPAGTVKAGTVLQLETGGTLLNNSGANISLQYKFKIGATTVVATTAANVGTNASERKWVFRATIMFPTATTQRVQVTMPVSLADASNWGQGSATSVGYGTASEAMAGDTTLDLTLTAGTAATTFTMKAEWATLTEQS